jgi:hypothetical protein
MIELRSHTQAERQPLAGACVQCISPYLNPAHILSPPRDWLEGLVEGDCSWSLFRLRYKALLRARFRADAEPFFALLQAAEGTLVLTCHCMAGPCHLDLAKDFLLRLRDQTPHEQWAALRRRLTLFPLPVEHPALALRHG